MSCPQDWAAKIHHDEGDEKESAIIIRNVPESIRRELKSRAAKDGKTMQGLVLELITIYVGTEEGRKK
jgi:plasmid stability protein